MTNTIQGLGRVDWDSIQLEVHKPTREEPGFTETLRKTINQMEEIHQDAEKQVADLLQGRGQDIHTTLIAVEKADLTFQLMMQVRNKIVQAYQEISRMPF